VIGAIFSNLLQIASNRKSVNCVKSCE